MSALLTRFNRVIRPCTYATTRARCKGPHGVKTASGVAERRIHPDIHRPTLTAQNSRMGAMGTTRESKNSIIPKGAMLCKVLCTYRPVVTLHCDGYLVALIVRNQSYKVSYL